MKVISKSLEKFPAKRYQTAAEFKRELMEAASGKKTGSASRSSKSSSVSSWLIPVLVGVGFAAIIVIFLILFL